MNASPGSSAIEFYFDFLSPYGYFAATQIERVSQQYDRQLLWRPFLIGVAVMQVMGLKPLMETPLKSDYILEDLPRMARYLGVPFRLPPGPLNSRAAARAFYWLDEQDPQLATEFAKTLLLKQWGEGRNLSDPLAVADQASQLGISSENLLEAIRGEAAKDRLREKVAEAIGNGVFGSPFFIVDGQRFWGVDRLFLLEHWLHWGDYEPRLTD